MLPIGTTRDETTLEKAIQIGGYSLCALITALYVEGTILERVIYTLVGAVLMWIIPFCMITSRFWRRNYLRRFSTRLDVLQEAWEEIVARGEMQELVPLHTAQETWGEVTEWGKPAQEPVPLPPYEEETIRKAYQLGLWLVYVPNCVTTYTPRLTCFCSHGPIGPGNYVHETKTDWLFVAVCNNNSEAKALREEVTFLSEQPASMQTLIHLHKALELGPISRWVITRGTTYHGKPVRVCEHETLEMYTVITDLTAESQVLLAFK